MNKISLSIEELIFCFYSEGMFEQGLEMKKHFFPEMDDNQLEFMFQVTCRSLLAKDLVEFKNHVYKVKEEFIQYIQVLNNAEFTVRASRHMKLVENETSLSVHYTKDGYYLHQIIHDQQVHQINRIESSDEVIIELKRFFNLGQLSDESDSLVVMPNEDFELLLKGANENEKLVWEILNKYNCKNELTTEFARDLVDCKGLLDSIMSLKYDEQNLPDLIDLIMVVPGANRTWFISGSIKNQFTIKIANNHTFQSLVTEQSSKIASI
jgi:hypothetical protein